MATKLVVEGDLYQKIDGKLFEIKRQIRQKEGYPFNPLILKRALQDIGEGKFETIVTDWINGWPVWMDVNVGTRPDAHSLRFDLKLGRSHSLRYIENILDYIVVEGKETVQHLVSPSGKDLGFDDFRVTKAMVYDQARALGLRLCSFEIVAQLLLQGVPKMKGRFNMATPPIPGQPHSHVAVDINGPIVMGEHGEDGCPWTVNDRWVFVRSHTRGEK